MSEPQSTTDLRILAEMADEIDKYGTTQLPASLRSHVQTERGKNVAKTLETVAHKLLDEKFHHRMNVERLQREIDGLRNEMQVMTDASLAGWPGKR